jgi:hypothetical protein
MFPIYYENMWYGFEFNDIKVFKDIHQTIITSVNMYYKDSIDGDIL